jgi:putative transposase
MGYARSSFYKALKATRRREVIAESTLSQVLTIRREMPMIGCKKIHFLLRNVLLQSGHKCMGRDRLFDLLRERNLLIKRRRYTARTTNSNHAFKVYHNEILGLQVNRPNQVWVSDITYVRTQEGFCYVSLITDLFSRKIVGHYVSRNLELEGCIQALRRALKLGKPEIHHSDRGSQYCSKAYTSILKQNGTIISMAQAGNCYENAVAERINGILKQEFNLNANFTNIKQVQKVLEQAVNVYNTKRPNWALKLKAPNEVFCAA